MRLLEVALPDTGEVAAADEEADEEAEQLEEEAPTSCPGSNMQPLGSWASLGRPRT